MPIPERPTENVGNTESCVCHASAALSPRSAYEACRLLLLRRATWTAVSTSMVFFAISVFTLSRTACAWLWVWIQTVCLPVASPLFSEAFAKPESTAE